MNTPSGLESWSQTLEALIDRFGLARWRSAIRSLARPRVSFRAARVDPGWVSPTRSFMGGLPFGPPSMRWPVTKEGRPLAHLMTIQLAEPAVAGLVAELPTTGTLVFWLDVHPEAATGGWPNYGSAGDHFRVDYLEGGPRVRLTPPGIPSTLPPEHWASPGGWQDDSKAPPVYNCCSLTWSAAIELPCTEWISDFQPQLVALNALEQFRHLCDELHGMQIYPDHHLLGYARGILSPSIEQQSQLMVNGVEGVAPDSGAAWRCLLQLDTDEVAPGWMWGDMGRAAFCIRERDLHAHRFGDCWAVVEG